MILASKGRLGHPAERHRRENDPLNLKVELILGRDARIYLGRVRSPGRELEIIDLDGTIRPDCDRGSRRSPRLLHRRELLFVENDRLKPRNRGG